MCFLTILFIHGSFDLVITQINLKVPEKILAIVYCLSFYYCLMRVYIFVVNHFIPEI